MKVHYSKGWAITFVLAGSLLIALNFILFNLTGRLIAVKVVPGFMVISVGLLYFFRTYFELRENEIVTFSLLGFVSWRYKFDHISDLSFEGNRLYRNKKGKIKRIRISGFVCNKDDWRKFKLMVERGEPGGELHD